MSLYGNVKRIGSSTFQFDKIYPNRKAMEEALMQGDGIYNGRYVLVEYGLRYQKDTESSNPGNNTVENSEYTANKNADWEEYGAVYDSTVWQKIYITQDNTSSNNPNTPIKFHEKYIMVAELNAMVPQLTLEEYDTATLIKTQAGEQELSGIYVGDDKELLHSVKDISYNNPYFDMVRDTELDYILHMPKPMELEVNEGIDYHQNKFDVYHSHYDDDNTQATGNFIGWKPVLKETDTESDGEGGQVLKQDTPFSKYTLNMDLPAFGDAIGMIYDTLFGTAVVDGGIRPYFANNGLYDDTVLEQAIQDPSKIDPRYADISKILANNSEGLAGVLSALFADKTIPGEIRYYLSADWLAKNSEDKSNVPSILNKPKVITSKENAEIDDTYNRHYRIDYYNWKLQNIFRDRLELLEIIAISNNNNKVQVTHNGNNIILTIKAPLSESTRNNKSGQWVTLQGVYTETPYPMHSFSFDVPSEKEGYITGYSNKTNAFIDIECSKWASGGTINFVITTNSPTIKADSTITIVWDIEESGQ